ncbi:hypothetical protein SAMN04515678_110109 [Roseivivax sediminis]|uniref:Response regulatory domain-containing protein n=2 Tax=Roseivivax sediminis TaxID=936889 RepID=A0A1I2AY54_9RHOB|nr:hypothetical protein SAMN04515678_110109 [Roseivivax sediminis]
MRLRYTFLRRPHTRRALGGFVITPDRTIPRLIVLSEDRVVAEDVAFIVRDHAPGAEVVLVTSLPDATARMATPAPPTAILMIEPRLGLDDHPLTIAAAQLGAWLVVIAEDAPTLPIGAATHVLGVQVPFTSQSLGPVISRVVRDRPQG